MIVSGKVVSAGDPRAFWNAIENAAERGEYGAAQEAVDAFDEEAGWDAAERAGVLGGYTLAREAALAALNAVTLASPSRHPGGSTGAW